MHEQKVKLWNDDKVNLWNIDNTVDTLVKGMYNEKGKMPLAGEGRFVLARGDKELADLFTDADMIIGKSAKNAAEGDSAAYLDGKLEELTFFTAIPWNSMKVAWGVLWYISFVSWSLSQPVFSARSVAWAEALL